MVEWTTAKIAGLILAIVVLLVIVIFLYTQMGSESSVVSAIDTIWGKYIPAS